MTKLIRIFVAGLSLCGALAVLPQVAEAREPGRPAAGHVARHDEHRDFRHDGRFDGRRDHWGHDARWCAWHRGYCR